ncbi:uncharacterized protein [Aristolochia californica]|uniref:uncharacterized protein n=1 Tax=Aristolochia californica TaxID=171875 RepID=UPI0035D7EECF
MAKLALSSPSTACLIRNPSPLISPPHFHLPKKIHRTRKVLAKLGGGDGDVKRADKKKFITREEEPEQYWQTAGEREGENPMKTPLPYIIIFGMSTPFVILAIAFANGWIKVPVR